MTILVIRGKEDKNGMNEGMEKTTQKSNNDKCPNIDNLYQGIHRSSNSCLATDQQPYRPSEPFCARHHSARHLIHSPINLSCPARTVTRHCEITGPAGHRTGQKMVRIPETE
jgi:hypothetical protein